LIVLEWLLVAFSWVAAVAAWVSARRTRRQLADLTAMYWQLKYDHGELKARVAPEATDPPPTPQAFVPLSQVKKN
jgi:hypothetical protein